MSSCWRVGLPAFVSDVIDALILIHHVLEELSPLVFVSDLIDGEMDSVNLFRHGAVMSKHMSSVHKKETQYPSIHRTTFNALDIIHVHVTLSLTYKRQVAEPHALYRQQRPER
jgi:hypothetical protein